MAAPQARPQLHLDDRLRLDDQLCFALYAATNPVVRRYRPLLAAIGLTYPQYLVMLVLWQDGTRSVSELADRLALPGNALTPVVGRLEVAGLVRRAQHPPDRRVVHVELTVAGAALETAATDVQRQVACSTRLSDDELAGLREQLHDLLGRMDVPHPPTCAGLGARTLSDPIQGVS